MTFWERVHCRQIIFIKPGLGSIKVDDSSESYFKFGDYHQAQNPETGEKIDDKDDWPSFYDEYISESDITFTNMSYIRNVD